MTYENPPIAGDSSLSSVEVRVLGCLLEKQRTTPDTYPLSMNSLRLACNQSTNRDPVVDYDEATIREALGRLERRRYTRLASAAGSRAAKYRHMLAEALPMDDGEQALICVLMLRGAQTPGELKQRGERMHFFEDLGEVHQTLERMIGRGLVERLERRPGHKEERYLQLLGGSGDEAARERVAWEPATAPGEMLATAPAAMPATPAPAPGELEELRARVERLEREIAELHAKIRHPMDQQSA